MDPSKARAKSSSSQLSKSVWRRVQCAICLVAGAAVGLYIGAAYWFTASTSFANPAVTIARALTPSFAGIRPADAPAFVAVQFAAAILGTALLAWLFRMRLGRRSSAQFKPPLPGANVASAA